MRKYSDQYEVLEDRVISSWHPFPGIAVTTTIVPQEYGHLRVHEIESQYDCTAYDCGFAVKKFADEYEQKAAGTTALVSNQEQCCQVTGEGPCAAGFVIESDPNTNVLYPNAAIPSVSYRIKKGETIRIETQVKSSIR